MKVDSNQREQQGHKVGEIVSSFGEQGQRMGAHSGYNQQAYIGGGYEQRYAEDFRGALVGTMRVNMHLLSLRMAREGFKADSSRWSFVVGVRSSEVRQMR